MEKVRYISIALLIGLLALFVAPTLVVTVGADPPDPTPQPVEKWTPGESLPLIWPLAYPTDPTGDIAWSAGTSGVADIQTAFNNARTTENGQLGTLVPAMTLPSQATWDAMSNGEKALWLINRERVDRGVHPLHGVETNVTSVAQNYANYLLVNNAFGHTADGKDPWIRLDENPAIGACRDFLNVAENLAAFWTSGTSIPLPVERSVYMWMYDDSGSAWGHRHAILWYPYNDNSGPAGQEGFLGIGRASGPHQGWNFAEIIVMNVFDPCATWTYAAPGPTAPSGLTATPVPPTQINLSWTDNSNNETGFRIERSLNGTTWTQIATVGANVTTYSDTGLISNQFYYYRVRAYNAQGNSGYSNIASTMPSGNVLKVFLPIVLKGYLPQTITNLYIQNDTGGNTTVCISGIACKTGPPGLGYWGSFPSGTYSWSAQALCGTASGTKYFSPGEVVWRFLCGSGAASQEGGTLFWEFITYEGLVPYDAAERWLNVSKQGMLLWEFTPRESSALLDAAERWVDVSEE